ncbi:MAG: hypothetical protein QOI53_3309 [Verrucomicrobiota bacterium]|jgi:hypothetical protein|nr:hypothetical protein [Verrucomicrobiota bacterium]
MTLSHVNPKNMMKPFEVITLSKEARPARGCVVEEKADNESSRVITRLFLVYSYFLRCSGARLPVDWL